MKFLIGIATVSILLSGCVAKAGRTSGVHYGMSKQEVVAVMGAPISVNTHGSIQDLNYSVCETENQTLSGIMHPYVVRLADGRVESYGTTGNIDSPQASTSRLESDQIVKQDVRAKEPVDLHTELMKLKQLKDAGLLTEEEFRIQKRKVLEKY